MKYSHNLCGIIKEHKDFSSLLRLAEDGKSLILLNKKYTARSLYTMESQMAERSEYLQDLKERKENDKKKDAYLKILQRLTNMQKQKTATLKGFTNKIRGEQDTDSEDEDAFAPDSDQLEENTDYQFVKSNFTYKLEDLEAIIIGGISSRFWQIRKYMNLLQSKEYD